VERWHLSLTAWRSCSSADCPSQRRSVQPGAAPVSAAPAPAPQHRSSGAM